MDNIRPKKELSQNWLKCPKVVEKVLQSAVLGPKNVTELGPGTGALTKPLLDGNFSVRAIEKDPEAAEQLEGTSKGLELILGDLKEEDWSWQADWQLIGNIPYALSGLIIRKLTQIEQHPEQALLIVQKEVGQRLTSQAPDMSLITLAVQLWGEASKLMEINRSCFQPQPKVDSQLIKLTPAKETISNREEIMAFAKPIFQQKRKQIGGSLKRLYGLAHPDFTTQRPQELTKEEWIRLLAVYNEVNDSAT